MLNERFYNQPQQYYYIESEENSYRSYLEPITPIFENFLFLVRISINCQISQLSFNGRTHIFVN